MGGTKRINTSGGEELSANPFEALESTQLPNAHQTLRRDADSAPVSKTQKRGRVNVRREKAGRGGKTVTVIYDFERTVHTPEREQMLKSLKAKMGCGGAFKDGQLELQGDRVEPVIQWLCEQGFRAVKAGG